MLSLSGIETLIPVARSLSSAEILVFFESLDPSTRSLAKSFQIIFWRFSADNAGLFNSNEIVKLG
jgi:hypothetical protein